MRYTLAAPALLVALLGGACADLGGNASDDGKTLPTSGKDVTAAPSDDDYLYAPAGECDSAHNYVVHFVNDGDTFTVKGGAKVRLLGVDASELSEKECHSEAATDFMKTQLPQNTIVCLLPDANGDDIDMYKRWLRYAYVTTTAGHIQLNARALRLGHARVFEGFASGLRFESQLRAMQDRARAEKRGGWGNCGW